MKPFDDHETIESTEEVKSIQVVKKSPKFEVKTKSKSMKYKEHPSDTNDDSAYYDEEDDEEDDVYNFTEKEDKEFFTAVIEKTNSSGHGNVRTLELQIDELFMKVAQNETSIETIK